MNERLTTAEVAGRAGVNLETVRYYERRGLIPEPPRSPSGYRQYDAGHVKRIRFIKRAQQLGFSLDEITELLSLKTQPGLSSGEVKQRAEDKIANIELKIQELTRMKQTLETLARSCSGEGPAQECSILAAIESPEDETEAFYHINI